MPTPQVDLEPYKAEIELRIAAKETLQDVASRPRIGYYSLARIAQLYRVTQLYRVAQLHRVAQLYRDHFS